MSTTNKLIRQAPSGPILQYPVSLAGQVLTVLADGTVDPLPSGVLPAPATSRIVFCSPVFGNDTTGLGTEQKPFATIAHAYSTITTASAASPWQIVLFEGTYAENVALKPFIRVEGWDKAKAADAFYPARINGNVTLDASFSAAGAFANLTAIDIDGTTTLDFTGSADGEVCFAGCQLEDDVTVSGVLQNHWELHECTLFANVTQTGCTGAWYNTENQNASLLHVRAATGTAVRLDLYNSVWVGALTADQNGAVGLGESCVINLSNSEAREGVLSIVASGSNCPIVNGAFGATPENPVLSGSASAHLSAQMRVALALSVPAATLIPNGEITDVVIPLTTLGATSIEDLSWQACPRTDAWVNELLTTGNCLWSFHVIESGGVPALHVVLGNIGAAPVTTTAALPLLFTAFLPSAVI